MDDNVSDDDNEEDSGPKLIINTDPNDNGENRLQVFVNFYESTVGYVKNCSTCLAEIFDVLEEHLQKDALTKNTSEELGAVGWIQPELEDFQDFQDCFDILDKRWLLLSSLRQIVESDNEIADISQLFGIYEIKRVKLNAHVAGSKIHIIMAALRRLSGSGKYKFVFSLFEDQHHQPRTLKSFLSKISSGWLAIVLKCTFYSCVLNKDLPFEKKSFWDFIYNKLTLPSFDAFRLFADEILVANFPVGEDIANEKLFANVVGLLKTIPSYHTRVIAYDVDGDTGKGSSKPVTHRKALRSDADCFGLLGPEDLDDEFYDGM